LYPSKASQDKAKLTNPFKKIRQRKHLPHQQLIAEVIQQLANRFQPDINMIKQKIESLLEREYIDRGPDAATPSYTYLA
jgi:cullin 3